MARSPAGNVRGFAHGQRGNVSSVYGFDYALTEFNGQSATPDGVASLLGLGNRLYMGTSSGEVFGCGPPCNSVELLHNAPSARPYVTGLAASPQISGKLFYMAVPTTDVGGGIYQLDLATRQQQQLATRDQLLRSAFGVGRPKALAVDSEYVYWPGLFEDPRDHVVKQGLLRRNHRTLAPAEPFLEADHGDDTVSGIALDETHVFWTYDRDARTLWRRRRRGRSSNGRRPVRQHRRPAGEPSDRLGLTPSTIGSKTAPDVRHRRRDRHDSSGRGKARYSRERA